MSCRAPGAPRGASDSTVVCSSAAVCEMASPKRGDGADMRITSVGCFGIWMHLFLSYSRTVVHLKVT